MISGTPASMGSIIQSAVAGAIAHCSLRLTSSVEDVDTHRVIRIGGLAGDSEMHQETAIYLVGLIADAIDVSLQIRARLSFESNDHVELVRSVEKLVGSPGNPLDAQTMIDTRNPWMVEGIVHLCMCVAAAQSSDSGLVCSIHPVGNIVGLNKPHISAKEQGMDNVVIYVENGEIGLSIIESKAYKNDPNKAISESVRYFAEVDTGLHDVRIRQVTNSMLDQLPPGIRDAAPASFWKQRRCYLPNPCYQPVIDWASSRPSLKKLAVNRDYRLILPVQLSDFDGYFQDIAIRMLRFAQTVQSEAPTDV